MNDDLALADLVDQLTEQMHGQLVKAIQQASEARAACTELVRNAQIEDGPDELHQTILTTRAQIERLEYLTSQLVLLKAKSAQAVADRKAQLEDAYMKAATSKTVGFSDYASAKAQDAAHATKTIAETLALRKVERTHRDVDSAWDYCRALLRGAEGVHRDLEIRIRLITLSGQLDR